MGDLRAQYSAAHPDRRAAIAACNNHGTAHGRTHRDHDDGNARPAALVLSASATLGAVYAS
jgi:hypothetical protein